MQTAATLFRDMSFPRYRWILTKTIADIWQKIVTFPSCKAPEKVLYYALKRNEYIHEIGWFRERRCMK